MTDILKGIHDNSRPPSRVGSNRGLARSPPGSTDWRDAPASLAARPRGTVRPKPGNLSRETQAAESESELPRHTTDAGIPPMQLQCMALTQVSTRDTAKIYNLLGSAKSLLRQWLTAAAQTHEINQAKRWLDTNTLSLIVCQPLAGRLCLHDVCIGRQAFQDVERVFGRVVSDKLVVTVELDFGSSRALR